MKYFLSFAIFLSSFSAAMATNYTGEAYQQGSNRQVKLFDIKTTTKTEGDAETIHSVFTDPSGKVLIEQKVEFKAGKLVRDEVQQKQLNQVGVIEVQGDQVLFSIDKSGKVENSKEKYRDPLVVSASFQGFVKQNWEQILAGKKIGFRYGVWHRKETVGFEIFKDGEETVDGEQRILLTMKPSSFIIAALVKPIKFSFSQANQRLMMMNGRVAPMKEDKSKFSDLDAEVFYKYE